MKRVATISFFVLIIIGSIFLLQKQFVSNENNESVSITERVKIYYPTYSVGTHSFAIAEKKILDSFNERYGNEIELVVDEIVSDWSYIQMMEVLASTGELPNVLEGKNGIRELAIQSGKAVDLRELFNQNPDFRSLFSDEVIKANTMEDGSIYSLAADTVVIGYYYNQSIFDEVGIKPAATWDEFNMNCEKLLQAGYTPLGMSTRHNSWGTNLFLSAIIASYDSEGLELMSTACPTTYKVPAVLYGLEQIRYYFQNYTTEDAIGGNFKVATDHFLNEEVAMIANGPWMIDEINDSLKAPEGFSERVDVALFPESSIIALYQEGYVVCADTEEEKQAAFKLLEVLTDKEAQLTRLEYSSALPSADIEISDSIKMKNPILARYIDLYHNAETQFKALDWVASPEVINILAESYPKLANNQMTPEELVDLLDETITNCSN